MNKKKSFLGTGWGFPPSFNKDLASVEMVSDEQDIKESLHIYLSTKIGERIMRSNYGCLIHDYIFESIDDNTISTIGHEIKRTIYEFEPRIHVIDVKTNKKGYEPPSVINHLEQKTLDDTMELVKNFLFYGNK